MASHLNPLPTRRRRTSLLVGLGLAVVLAGLVVVLATRPSATTRVADSPLVGRLAPPLTGETIDGQPFDLAELRGRWVLVNFFATWCVPCRQEHPELIRFQERHGATGDAAVVGVVFDDSAAAVRSFRADEGGSWPMVLDPAGQISVDYGVAGVPESFLLAPNGILAAKIVGGVRDDQLERVLREAAAGRRAG